MEKLGMISEEEEKQKLAPVANVGAPQQVFEIRIAVPNNMIKRVIARGGETIKRISDECGARLQIEREPNEVSAKGDTSQLEIARMLIHDIVTAPVRQTSPAGAAGAAGDRKPEYIIIVLDSQGQEGRIDNLVVSSSFSIIFIVQ